MALMPSGQQEHHSRCRFFLVMIFVAQMKTIQTDSQRCTKVVNQGVVINIYFLKKEMARNNNENEIKLKMYLEKKKQNANVQPNTKKKKKKKKKKRKKKKKKKKKNRSCASNKQRKKNKRTQGKNFFPCEGWPHN